MDHKCPVCGAPMSGNKCPYCDYEKEPEKNSEVQTTEKVVVVQQPIESTRVIVENAKSNKNKMTALIVCIFLGVFGGHYFYVGKTGMGVLYLLTLGVFGIGWIVDVFRIAAGSFSDKFGRELC